MGSHAGCSIIPPGIPPEKGGIPPGTHLGSQVGLAGSHLIFLPGTESHNVTRLWINRWLFLETWALFLKTLKESSNTITDQRYFSNNTIHTLPLSDGKCKGRSSNSIQLHGNFFTICTRGNCSHQLLWGERNYSKTTGINTVIELTALLHTLLGQLLKSVLLPLSPPPPSLGPRLYSWYVL